MPRPRPDAGSVEQCRSPDPGSAPRSFSRRDVLAWSGSCCAHLLWTSALSSVAARRLFAAEPRGTVVAEAPWARIERIHDGVWAIVSTPLGKDWTTLCNGGIVAGTERVLIVESFARPEGAAWAASQALALAGRRPTDVVITHYHGDHSNGLGAFAGGEAPPRVWTTPTTLELLRRRQRPASDGRSDETARATVLDRIETFGEDEVTEIDLGGRKVRLHPRAGHTASDATVELDDPGVVFYGDLLWNRMFPNFRDTTPTVFAASIRAAMRQSDTAYVPGHGPLAERADIERLLEVLGEVEAVARKTFGTEVTAGEAANRLRLPSSLGEWTLFSDDYYQVAIGAWHRELAASS